MTAEEIKAEIRYRNEERLGILAGSQMATAAQRAIASAETAESMREILHTQKEFSL